MEHGPWSSTNMFGIPDDIYTNEDLTALITKWEEFLDGERREAHKQARNGEPVIAEGCWGRISAYRICIADLKKLRDF